MSGSPGGADTPPGLYVHVPFCTRVCPYCDFAVQTGGPAARRGFVDALIAEIELWGDRLADANNAAATERVPATGAPADPAPQPRWRRNREFDTVYLGGGTPSALSGDQLGEILDAVRGRLPIAGDAEITLEANPEDIDEARTAAWRELGIGRLSIGVQSFDADTLSFLGREHTPERAVAAVTSARDAGFDSVSLDLIFAVPGQGGAALEASVHQAAKLQPDHISCYELTVHERTQFFRARAEGALVELADDDKASEFFRLHELLKEAGYAAYEVSNFAHGPEYRSRHNTKYWRHVPYLGIGPSAHSFDGDRTRWWNLRGLADWRDALAAEGSPIAEIESLDAEQLALERLALGLRTIAGVDVAEIDRRYGLDVAARNRPLIERLRGEGLLEAPGSATPVDDAGPAVALVPTLAGMAVADSLAAAFDLGGSGPP